MAGHALPGTQPAVAATDARHGAIPRKWTPLQIRTLVFAALILFFDGYDLLSISFAAPHIRSELQLGAADLARIFSVGLIGMIGGGLLLGPLADRRGMRGVTVFSFLLAGAATFATAFAQNVEQIMLLRFLTGIGLGGAMPGAFVYAGDYALATRRRTTLAVIGIFYGLGGAAAGFASSYLLVVASWHAIFLLGGGLTVLIGLLAALFMPQSLSFLAERGSPDHLDRLLARLPAGLAVARKAAGSVARFPVITLFEGGWWRMTIGLWGASFLLLLAYFLIINWMPTVIAAGGGDPQVGSRALMFMQLGQAAGGLAIGIAMDRIRSPFLMATVATITALIAAAASQLTGAGGLFAMCCMAMGFFHAGSQGSVNYTATLVYPPAARVTGIAWVLSIGRTGAIIGPLLGGVLIAGPGGLPVFFMVAAGLILGAAGILFATALVARGRLIA